MHRLGKLIFIEVISLAFFGLIIIGSASVVAADHDFGNKWYYLRAQAVWAVLGIGSMLAVMHFPHQKLAKIAVPLFVITVLFLLAVLIPGLGTKIMGARRWLNLGLFTFQPAELAKLTSVIFFANLYRRGVRFFPFAMWTGILAILVMLEPDMGTSLVIIGSASLQYLGSGGKTKFLLLSTPLVIAFAIVVIIFSPYRLSRVKTFLDPSHDPQGASYQVRQSLMGIGAGGLFGKGLGESRQKYEFLPEVSTDSIFAVVGEELGFFGTVALAIIFLSLTLTGLQIAYSVKDTFSSSIAIGISSWFGLQAFINMSAVAALVPFTGIPLSFISYGGSSLLITLIASGILINIAVKNNS